MQEQNLNEQLQQQAGDSDLQKAMEGLLIDKETGADSVEVADRLAILGGGAGGNRSKALLAAAMATAASTSMVSPWLGGMKRFTPSKVYRDVELTPMERMQRDMAVKTHNAQVEMQRKLKKDAKKARAEVKAALK